MLAARRTPVRDPQLGGKKNGGLQIRTCHKKIASMEIGIVVPFFGGPWHVECNISCPEVLAALMSFVLMKMILLACGHNFPIVHVQCHFQQQCCQNRFGPFKEVEVAIRRLKSDKSGDGAGFAAEL